MSSATETSHLLSLDPRSDSEILAELKTYRPIDKASERNIWAFWDQGLANCKPWCQRNIIGWARRHSTRWTVRVIDMVDGSPNHYSNYFSEPASFFPDALLHRTMSGDHAGPHAADLIRLPLLYLYGGVWLDVGFLLFRDLDDLCWHTLIESSSLDELAGFKMTISPSLAMFWNGFIAARKGSRAIKLWHDMFLKIWNGRNSCKELHSHPMLRHLSRYEVPSSTGQPPAFAYEDYVDYLAQMFCLERLRHLRDPSQDWDGPQFFDSRVLLFECVSEVYWAQHLTHWDGRKQFNMLSCLHDLTEPGYFEAEKFIQDVLSNSSTMKISHGIPTDQREYLARIWDEPANEDADCRAGTFAAYLRWASIYFQQSKKLTRVKLPVNVESILTGDLLEVLGEPRD